MLVTKGQKEAISGGSKSCKANDWIFRRLHKQEAETRSLRIEAKYCSTALLAQEANGKEEPVRPGDTEVRPSKTQQQRT